MAAIEVQSDDRIRPAFNIAQPTPTLNFGFEWNPVAKDIPISPANPNPQHREASAPTVLQKQPPLVNAAAAPPPDHVAETSDEELAKQFREQLRFGKPVEKGADPIFPLALFKGAWAGNGFNTIFRPRRFTGLPAEIANDFADWNGHIVQGSVPKGAIPDNVLQLNLTLEQLSFSPAIGHIPNRGFGQQDDINLFGVAYLQTVSDVTNPETGLGDRGATGIHLEPGIWLNVPPANFHDNKHSIVRMASIPHGTTINAQGFSPPQNSPEKSIIGGQPGAPNFDLPENQVNTSPFLIGHPERAGEFDHNFPSLKTANKGTFRIPQDLTKLSAKGKITDAIIKNPNLYLKIANSKLNIAETITFEVHTGPGPPDQTMNGGGTANIAFLQGHQDPITTAAPSGNLINAHARSAKITYWISVVKYKVRILERLEAGKHSPSTMATMDEDCTAPTPKFVIVAPSTGLEPGIVEVPGIQIQSSQNVLLDFGTLSWPHVSVSTLVPTWDQEIIMPEVKK